MKRSTLLFTLAALLPTSNVFAANPPLADYLTCGSHSFVVVGQAPFKSLVESETKDGHVLLKGGQKTDLGKQWMFAKPVELDGLTLTGFFSEDMTMMGSRIINWGFLVQQPPEQAAAVVSKIAGTQLVNANGVFARPEIWSEQQNAWLPEGDDTAGKLVTDTSERVLMVEPAPKGAGNASQGMLTCSVQGKISEAALRSARPDLAATASH